MPIKSSVLIRTLSDHGIGSIREQLAADVERLEGYGDKIDGFISSNNRDEPPKECERKPLKYAHSTSDGLFVVIRDSDNAILTTTHCQKIAERKASNFGFPLCSIVRVLEPVGNECDVERIAPEGCEWGIMGDGSDGWMKWLTDGYGWRYCINEEAVLRFPSKSEAAAYINKNGIANCQPWPVPAS